MATWVDIGPQQTYYTATTYDGSRAVSATTFPVQQEDILGTLRIQLDITGTSNIRILRFVKVGASSAACASGMPMFYTTNDKSAVDSRNAAAVTLNNISGVGIGAITAGNRGWIQVYGPGPTLTLASGTCAQGDALIMSTTDAKVSKVTAGTAPTNKVIAWAGAASSSTTVATNFIECL